MPSFTNGSVAWEQALLEDHRGALQAMTDSLLDVETLDSDQIDTILDANLPSDTSSDATVCSWATPT